MATRIPFERPAGRGRRRAPPEAIDPGVLALAELPEPAPDAPPERALDSDLDPEPSRTLDLTTVTLPRWLMPFLRDLMETAERTFGRRSGWQKKTWVRDAASSAMFVRELATDTPLAFPPDPFREPLLDILIEGVWALQFRGLHPPDGRPRSRLQRALDGDLPSSSLTALLGGRPSPA